MTINALQFDYSGGSGSASPPENTTITVLLKNGEFVAQQSEYTLTVFYGVPPKYSGNYPVTSFYLYPEKLEFMQNINSFYSAVNVKTYDSTISGSMTTPNPLPYSISVNLIGSGQYITLEPGQLSVDFNLPVERQSVDAIEAEVNAKVTAIRKS